MQMSANDIIMWIMAAGFVIGGVDYMAGDRLGLGKKFREGIDFFGAAALSMAGLMCLVPEFSEGIKAILHRTGTGAIDPAMAASVIGINMGGHALAMELMESRQIGVFCGIVVCSMLGATITFTIPTGLGIIEKEDRPYFAKGLMLGLITVPAGCFVGARVMGISVRETLINEIPVLVLAAVLILGLYFIPERLTVGFVGVGRLIQLVSLAGLVLGGFSYISGWKVLGGMKDLMPVMEVVSGMCVVMAGSFVIMELVMRGAGSHLERLGQKVGINGTAVSGMLFSFISLFPAFYMMKDMNPRGKVVCTAFFVGSTCAVGGHLSYAAAEEPDFIVAMLVGKMTAAVLGAVLALVLEKPDKIISEKMEKTS